MAKRADAEGSEQERKCDTCHVIDLGCFFREDRKRHPFGDQKRIRFHPLDNQPPGTIPRGTPAFLGLLTPYKPEAESHPNGMGGRQGELGQPPRLAALLLQPISEI